MGYADRHAIGSLRERMAGMALDIGRLHGEATEARERLYAAWKSGAEIPSAAAVAPAPVFDESPLSEALTAHVLDWEDDRAQAQQLRFIRSRLAAGKSEAEVLRELATPAQ